MRYCEKKITEADRPQKKIWLMRISSWIPKATMYTHNTHYLLIFHYTNAPPCYVIVHCLLY